MVVLPSVRAVSMDNREAGVERGLWLRRGTYFPQVVHALDYAHHREVRRGARLLLVCGCLGAGW